MRNTTRPLATSAPSVVYMPVACMSGGAGRHTSASPCAVVSRRVTARRPASESGTGSPISRKPLALMTGYSQA